MSRLQSQLMKQRWADPQLRMQMLRGSQKGGEASRNLGPREQIERVIRIQRTKRLKRFGS